MFIFTVKRGAILIGAFDEPDRMIGFAYSVVGMKDGTADAVVAHDGRAARAPRRAGLPR